MKNQKPRAKNQEPRTNNQQPTTRNQQPGTNDDNFSTSEMIMVNHIASWRLKTLLGQICLLLLVECDMSMSADPGTLSHHPPITIGSYPVAVSAGWNLLSL